MYHYTSELIIKWVNGDVESCYGCGDTVLEAESDALDFARARAAKYPNSGFDVISYKTNYFAWRA